MTREIEAPNGDDTGPAVLSARDLSHAFSAGARRLPVIERISFDVASESWLTFLGPSGCGKTTLLRILAGLIQVDVGTVTTRSRLGLPFGTAYLPQSDTLLPWRTALDNAILAQEIAGIRRSESREEARRLFEQFGLGGFESRYPMQLSGGMRQRVAIIRTFLEHRDILLLDEPLGSLDPLTRFSVQDWLLDVWSQLRKSIVLVTHDVEEALVLSDRVHLLSGRPATIRRSIDVGLERPRDRSGHELADQKRALLESLMGGLP